MSVDQLPRLFLLGIPDAHNLPVGARFQCVYAPEKQPAIPEQATWRVCDYEVVMSRQIRPPHAFERCYADIGQRPVTECEALALWAAQAVSS